MAELNHQEKIQLEPSALAGMIGPAIVHSNVEYLHRMNFTAEKLANATHLIWATGGGMVPEVEMEKYLLKLEKNG